MVAKVKIAPVERWCQPMQEAVKSCHHGELAVGQEIEIETGSMRTAQKVLQCGGREWQVLGVPSFVQPIDPMTGKEADDLGWICEHMIELD